MASIEGVKLAALVRSQLDNIQAKRQPQLRGSSGAPRNTHAGAEARSGHDAKSTGNERLLSALRELSPIDPDAPRKAFRLYLQAKLQEEFRGRLTSSADAEQLTDQVLQRMYEDGDLEESCLVAGRALLEQAHQEEGGPSERDIAK